MCTLVVIAGQFSSGQEAIHYTNTEVNTLICRQELYQDRRLRNGRNGGLFISIVGTTYNSR